MLQRWQLNALQVDLVIPSAPGSPGACEASAYSNPDADNPTENHPTNPLDKHQTRPTQPSTQD